MIITLPQVLVFFLIFARIIGLLTQAPVFSRKDTLMMGKITLAIWLSGLLIFVVPLPVHYPANAIAFTLALISEFFIGYLIGFVSYLLVIGLEMAGSLMDTQAGLSVATILDPSSGRNVTIISQLLNLTALIIFLQLNGLHMVLAATVKSFSLIPPGAPVNYTEAVSYVMKLGGYIFEVGVQMAMPIMLVVFMIDFAFGLLNRTAEQINVFQLGFQVKPPISILVLMAMTPGLIGSISAIVEKLMEHTLTLFHVMQL